MKQYHYLILVVLGVLPASIRGEITDPSKVLLNTQTNTDVRFAGDTHNMPNDPAHRAILLESMREKSNQLDNQDDPRKTTIFIEDPSENPMLENLYPKPNTLTCVVRELKQRSFNKKLEFKNFDEKPYGICFGTLFYDKHFPYTNHNVPDHQKITFADYFDEMEKTIAKLKEEIVSLCNDRYRINQLQRDNVLEKIKETTLRLLGFKEFLRRNNISATDSIVQAAVDEFVEEYKVTADLQPEGSKYTAEQMREILTCNHKHSSKEESDACHTQRISIIDPMGRGDHGRFLRATIFHNYIQMHIPVTSIEAFVAVAKRTAIEH